jgi:imidazolonepropionase-like amidohydrolase
MNMPTIARALVAPTLLLCASTALAQTPPVSAAAQPYISVNAPVVALTHVQLIDGTGSPARPDQTIVLRDGRIAEVGRYSDIRVPQGAQVIDLTGHTVIPGIVGMHDHTYYAGSFMSFNYARLYLGAGVTTIRTTGSFHPYDELNLRAALAAGRVFGPEMFVTGPYLQGDNASMSMHPVSGPEDARRMVRYWAEEGVSWFKAYTTISRAALAAAIDEAHKHGVKVTGHLCSIGFREAVALGIDNVEHGLLANTEYWKGKVPDVCPPESNDSGRMYADLDIGSAEVQQTFKDMIARNVAMTSTLAVLELSLPDRIQLDERVLDAVGPDVRANLIAWKAQTDKQPANPAAHAAFRKAMEYEKAFVRAGGLLAAGSDPCCLTAIAGYADQRNYELLIEATFKPEEVVRIMTLNGAKVLGIDARVGSVTQGKQADLVVLRGDLDSDPKVIRNTVTVFKNGVGYDSGRLIASVKGRIR